jgi:UTP--glucose-1-phosphate uridylyltransferase
LLDERDGVVPLPVIVNRKTVDPREPSSTPVIQLESAMGAAIESFAGSRLLEVPRTRFVPVKGTDDLCVLRSDVYRLTAEMQVDPVPERAASLPFVELDPAYYRLLDDFEARFPAGVPSLREAARFVVHGDVTFGSGVVARGDAELSVDRATRIEDGAVIGSV